ncbi:MAG: hypothetical protein GWN46_22700, partial [Gammaproteobacteria bacterium]|nr:hypothetical protein [Gammaproteobacteria bacterium]
MLLRSAWSLLVFLVTTPVCAFVGISWSLARGDEEMDLRPARIWSRWNLAAAGARVTYEGLEHARPGHPVIFVSNHASTADIWALVLAVPLETKFVAK